MKPIPDELKEAYRTFTAPWAGKDYREYIRGLLAEYDYRKLQEYRKERDAWVEVNHDA